MTAKHTRYSITLNYYVLKHIYRAADGDIAMQAYEPYDLHNTKISEVKYIDYNYKQKCRYLIM